MNSAPLRIQLSWDDPATGDKREPMLAVPIALGRDFNQMPALMQGCPVSRMVLNSLEVSRFHTLIDQDNSGLVAIDQNSRNGTFVNGTRIGPNERVSLANGDSLQIGPYQIVVSFGVRTQPSPSRNSQIFFNPNTGLPESNQSAPAPVGVRGVAPLQGTNFPPPIFQASEVAVQDLHATGLAVEEVDGRYAIAYSRTRTGQRDHAFVIARYVHLATGYPAIKFLPDLQ
ncbi:MAG: FHA domain-containing protein, partial [Cyanobacteriota bacterium]|nr:FHA domain-containing protein [Cyanobacteriota bacterium]